MNRNRTRPVVDMTSVIEAAGIELMLRHQPPTRMVCNQYLSADIRTRVCSSVG
jgi:hypothetical protein